MRLTASVTAGRIVLATLVATLALLATGTAVQGATSGLLRATGFEPGVKLIEGKHPATSYGLGTTSTARAGRQAAVDGRRSDPQVSHLAAFGQQHQRQDAVERVDRVDGGHRLGQQRIGPQHPHV